MFRFTKLKNEKISLDTVSQATGIHKESIRNWIKRETVLFEPQLGREGTGKTQFYTLEDTYEIAVIGYLAMHHIKPECGSQIARHVSKFFREHGGEELRKNARYLFTRMGYNKFSGTGYIETEITEKSTPPSKDDHIPETLAGVYIPIREVLDNIDARLWESIKVQREGV